MLQLHRPGKTQRVCGLCNPALSKDALRLATLPPLRAENRGAQDSTCPPRNSVRPTPGHCQGRNLRTSPLRSWFATLRASLWRQRSREPLAHPASRRSWCCWGPLSRRAWCPLVPSGRIIGASPGRRRVVKVALPENRVCLHQGRAQSSPWQWGKRFEIAFSAPRASPAWTFTEHFLLFRI